MARVSATASLGIKKSLGHKKGWGTYDNVSPHHSITFERNYPDDLTDEELVAKGNSLHKLARTMVEARIAEDVREANKPE